jgi:hypothetical protein
LDKNTDIESTEEKNNDHENNQTDKREPKKVNIHRQCPVYGCSEIGNFFCDECNVLAFYCTNSILSHEIHSVHQFQNKKDWYNDLSILDDRVEVESSVVLSDTTSIDQVESSVILLNSSVSKEPIDPPIIMTIPFNDNQLRSATQKRKNDDEIEQPNHGPNRRRREISSTDTNNDKEFLALQTVFLNQEYKDDYNSFVESILDNSEASVKQAACYLTNFVSNKNIFLYKNNLEAYVYIEDTNVKMQDSIEWRKSYIRWVLSVTKC